MNHATKIRRARALAASQGHHTGHQTWAAVTNDIAPTLWDTLTSAEMGKVAIAVYRSHAGGRRRERLALQASGVNLP